MGFLLNFNTCYICPFLLIKVNGGGGHSVLLLRSRIPTLKIYHLDLSHFPILFTQASFTEASFLCRFHSISATVQPCYYPYIKIFTGWPLSLLWWGGRLRGFQMSFYN